MHPAAAHILSRHRHRRPEDEVRFLDRLTLARGRVHELCGRSRRTLAMLVAAACKDEVFWIGPEWSAERLHGDGMAGLADPGRFLFITPRRAEDLLWCAEETLRAGVVPLVVADLPAAPTLTAIRRLHLAAEAGATGGTPPLGLVLTPEGAAAGVESRWRLEPGDEGWRLERLKARGAPPKAWRVTGGDRRLMHAD